MEDDLKEIPEALRPLLEFSHRSMADREIAAQDHQEFMARWKEKAIAIEAAEKFLDEHGKTGIFMIYWDQDENSPITTQSLTCGKSRMDRVLANTYQMMFKEILRGRG